MGEQRLIDANYIVEVAERAWDAWNLAMATQDTNRGVNKVIRRQELCKAVKAVADDAPTIDPESLPIVQQLQVELARVTEERDAAAKDLEKAIALYRDAEGWDILCRFCKGKSCQNGGDCKPEWRGLKEVLNNG